MTRLLTPFVLALALGACDKAPPRPPEPKAGFTMEPALLILVPVQPASAPMRLI